VVQAVFKKTAHRKMLPKSIERRATMGDAVSKGLNTILLLVRFLLPQPHETGDVVLGKVPL
jgi:hypothetical protein